MTDIETTVENARAQWHYPPIRTALLPSEADDLQLRLADRWIHRGPHQHALEVIADIGRVFDAEEAEPAIEALGRLLVHASLLAGCERMAIAPIIALGRELTRDSGVSSELPLRPAAMLAWAALGRSHDDAAIARGLAMAIAKAIDDCEIVHELKVDPLELFKVAAREVLDGKPVTAVTAPAVQPTQQDKAAQRALAWTELRKASEAVVADELKQVPDGEPVVLSQRPPEKCQMCGASGDVQDDDPEIWTCANGHHVQYCTRKAWDPDGGRPVNPDVGAAAAMVDRPELYDNKASGPVFGLAEFIPQTAPKTLETIAPVVEDIMRDEIQRRMAEQSPASVLRVPSPGEPGFTPFDDAAFARRVAQVSGALDCPGCGAPMSPVSGSPGEWICSNDHRK